MISSFLRGVCNAEAVMTAGVNGNGGGIRVARKSVIPALFSILDLSFSIFFRLMNRSNPFSPALRINRSITKTPITDPMQARIMQIMPVAFSVLFIFFPSGLVLYWLVNNTLQIGQQWHVNRMLEKEQALALAKKR